MKILRSERQREEPSMPYSEKSIPLREDKEREFEEKQGPPLGSSIAPEQPQPMADSSSAREESPKEEGLGSYKSEQERTSGTSAYPEESHENE